MTICDSIHSLTILRKSSIITFVGALSPTLITDIFASQSWVLINLKPIFLSYRNWSISSNSKDGWLLRHRNISVSNILRKDNLKLIRDSFHPARCKNRSIKYFFQTTKQKWGSERLLTQLGFSTCFSEHLYMASSYVGMLKILKTFCY